MGLTFNLGRVSPSVFTDSSLNVGIGAAPSGSYKLEVTGTAKVSSTLLVSGAATFSSSVTATGNIKSSNAGATIYTELTTDGVYATGTNLYLYAPSTKDISLYAGDVQRMRITSAGNVGIGVSPFAWDSGTESALQVKAASIYSYGNYELGLQENAYYNSNSWKYMYSTSATQMQLSSGEIIFRNAASGSAGATITWAERMRITSGGKVMVNTTDSGVNALLYASASSSEPYPLGSKATTSSQGLVGFFDSANGLQGSISISGSTVSYNSFMGSHWSQLSDNSKPEILIGTILEAIDELCEWDNITDERLPKVKISDIVESKNVYGVFSNWDNTDDYNDMYVAAVGAGFIRVNSNEIVSMGDLLESNGDGTAKIQSDDIMRSSTIAKVTSTQKINTYEDGSYLIAATLHCG